MERQNNLDGLARKMESIYSTLIKEGDVDATNLILYDKFFSVYNRSSKDTKYLRTLYTWFVKGHGFDLYIEPTLESKYGREMGEILSKYYKIKEEEERFFSIISDMSNLLYFNKKRLTSFLKREGREYLLKKRLPFLKSDIDTPYYSLDTYLISLLNNFFRVDNLKDVVNMCDGFGFGDFSSLKAFKPIKRLAPKFDIKIKGKGSALQLTNFLLTYLDLNRYGSNREIDLFVDDVVNTYLIIVEGKIRSKISTYIANLSKLVDSVDIETKSDIIHAFFDFEEIPKSINNFLVERYDLINGDVVYLYELNEKSFYLRKRIVKEEGMFSMPIYEYTTYLKDGTKIEHSIDIGDKPIARYDLLNNIEIFFGDKKDQNVAEIIKVIQKRKI